MVQQNYLKAQVTEAPQQYMWLDRVSKAADAIVDGDLVRRPRNVLFIQRPFELSAHSSFPFASRSQVSNVIRSNMNFSMLPMQAYESCIRPGYYMRGHLSGRTDFTAVRRRWRSSVACEDFFRRAPGFVVCVMAPLSRHSGWAISPRPTR